MIFRPKKDLQEHPTQINGNESVIPVTEHPKILLIDLDSEVAVALRDEGYNVAQGSFGQPYGVANTTNFHPLVSRHELPDDYAEYEIIVVDLAAPPTLNLTADELTQAPSQFGWYTHLPVSKIDPRPAVMRASQEKFDRILASSGVFVVFASDRFTQVFRHVSYSEDEQISNWDVLSVLGALPITFDVGQEIYLEVAPSPLYSLLSRHRGDATFRCTLKPYGEHWLPLAKNKFGDVISACYLSSDDMTDVPGLVFVMPRFRNVGAFLSEFLRDVLPDLAPHLFPDKEGGRWVERPDYEIPKVLDLRAKIEVIEVETKRRVEEIQNAIGQERSDQGYQHGLLTGTGDSLKADVKVALTKLGFADVIDVDRDRNGIQREDLQISDSDGLILVEVKGLKNCPSQDDALEVRNYLMPRVRELGRTDIRGLTIINYERHKPALERNPQPFIPDVVETAIQQQITLMTTWDLFRLLRSFEANQWSHEHVRLLFRRDGLFLGVPTHYEYVGKIGGYFEDKLVAGIEVEHAPIKLGDRLAFELPVTFCEQMVESLHVGKVDVSEAAVGTKAGVLTSLTKDQARKGTDVYRVRQSD